MTLEQFQELCNKPIDEQRYHYMMSHDRTIYHTDIKENYFYEDEFRLIWNKRLLKFRVKSIGFCIKDNRVYFRNIKPSQIFCKNEKHFPFRQFNLDWVPSHLKKIVTLKCLEKIILKKITKPNQLLSYIRAYILRDKTLSLGAINKALLLFEHSEYRTPNFRLFKNVCNFNSFEAIDKIDKNLFYDIFKECFILGKRFNILWSEKRLKQFHQDNIKEMEAVTLKTLPNEEYNCEVKELNDEFKVIRNSHQLYLEGKYMKHCIYTYAKDIKNKQYLAIHYKDNEDEVTIGLRKDRDCYKFNQIKSFYNNPPKDEQKILDKLEQVWIQNQGINGIKLNLADRVKTLNNYAQRAVVYNNQVNNDIPF